MIAWRKVSHLITDAENACAEGSQLAIPKPFDLIDRDTSPRIPLAHVHGTGRSRGARVSGLTNRACKAQFASCRIA